MYRRILGVSLVGAVVVGILLLTATPSDMGTQDERVLTWVTSLASHEVDYFEKEILPEFEETSGIRVEMVYFPSDVIVPKLALERQAGNQIADLFSVSPPYMRVAIEAGIAKELTEFEPKIATEISPELVNISKFPDPETGKQKMYFIPLRPDVRLLFYRQDIFSQLEVEPPTTLEQLSKVASILRDHFGEGKLCFPNSSGSVTGSLLWEWIEATDGDPLSLTDEGSTRVFSLLQQMQKEGLLAEVSVPVDWARMAEMFAEGRCLIMQNWLFASDKLQALGVPTEAIGIAAGFPSDEQTAPMLGIDAQDPESMPSVEVSREAHVVWMQGLGLVKGSANSELALEFVKFISSRRVQDRLAKELGWVPTIEDALEDVSGYLRRLLETAYHNITNGSRLWPSFPQASGFFDALHDAYRRIVESSEDVGTTLKGASRWINEQLEALRKWLDENCIPVKLSVVRAGDNAWRNFPDSGGGNGLGWKGGGNTAAAVGYAKLRFLVKAEVIGNPGKCTFKQEIKRSARTDAKAWQHKPAPQGFGAANWALDDYTSQSTWLRVDKDKHIIKWMDAPGWYNLNAARLPCEYKAKFKATVTGTTGTSLSIEWQIQLKAAKVGASVGLTTQTDNLPQSRE